MAGGVLSRLVGLVEDMVQYHTGSGRCSGGPVNLRAPPERPRGSRNRSWWRALQMLERCTRVYLRILTRCISNLAGLNHRIAASLSTGSEDSSHAARRRSVLAEFVDDPKGAQAGLSCGKATGSPGLRGPVRPERISTACGRVRRAGSSSRTGVCPRVSSRPRRSQSQQQLVCPLRCCSRRGLVIEPCQLQATDRPGR